MEGDRRRIVTMNLRLGKGMACQALYNYALERGVLGRYVLGEHTRGVMHLSGNR